MTQLAASRLHQYPSRNILHHVLVRRSIAHLNFPNLISPNQIQLVYSRRSPDCNPSAYTICTIDRPYGDLLSYPGACPDEAGRAKSAIGYTVKSLYCGRSSRDE